MSKAVKGSNKVDRDIMFAINRVYILLTDPHVLKTLSRAILNDVVRILWKLLGVVFTQRIKIHD